MNFKKLTTNDEILIMDGAQVLGDVTVGRDTSFWYNCVCRAEKVPVRIGQRCNIQDLAVIHNACVIGDDVSVGHGAIVHGAKVGDRVIIGMGAILLDGAVIGNDCIIAAGAVVTGKTVVPDGSMVIGSPAKVARPLNEKELAYILSNGAEYLEKSAQFRKSAAE